MLTILSHPARSYTVGIQYDGKEINLKQRTFHRYVLPQLRTMMREYYILLAMLHPLKDSLIDIKEEVENVFLSWEALKTYCSDIVPDKDKNSGCQKRYATVYKYSKRVDKYLLSLQNSITLSKRNSEESMENLINLTVTLSELMNLNYSIVHTVENSIATAPNILPRPHFKKRLDSKIHTARLLSDELLTGQFNKKEKEIFDFAWINFFKRINNHIIYKSDKQHLLRHLEELNIAWNTFSIKLTKGSTTHPKAVKTAVKVLHTRWNAILKVILQT